MRRLVPILVLAAACGQSEPERLDRVGHYDTIQFAPELGIDTADFQRVLTKLYMRVDRPGDPERREVRRGDVVHVHLRAWLPDGMPVVDTRAGGEPAEIAFGTGSMIRGLDFVMDGMRPGEVRTALIPPAMAYGVQGQDQIPPYATLVFEIELIDIV